MTGMVALHLKIAGASLLALALLHMAFPRRFRWREELAALSLLNRQIFYVHTFFIALVVAMMGVLALVFTAELVQPTPLARVILSGLALFWAVRLYAQWFVYDWALWRGHRFNTAMHALFTLLWAYYAAVFGWAAWLQFAAR